MFDVSKEERMFVEMKNKFEKYTKNQDIYFFF